MPSALEGGGDLVTDMNEVKGSIRDVQELCKDLLREINDLKSGNLSLRCFVENVKQDNTHRDNDVADIKHRLDRIDNKLFGSDINISSDFNVYRSENEEKICEYKTTSKLECNKISPNNVTYKKHQTKDYENNIIETPSSRPNDFDNELEQDNVSYSDSNLNYRTQPNLNEDEFNYKNFEGLKSPSVEDSSVNNREVAAPVISETDKNIQDNSSERGATVNFDNESYSSEEEEDNSEPIVTEQRSLKKLKEEIGTITNRGNEAAHKDKEEVTLEPKQREMSEGQEELTKPRKYVRWDSKISDDESETGSEWSEVKQHFFYSSKCKSTPFIMFMVFYFVIFRIHY